MCWILPKQLIALSGFSDTAEIISDSNELSQICAASLLARSKVTPARTWLQKWKRDRWTHFLSGRIVKHSHSKCFEDWWISSLLPTRARDSVVPVNKRVLKTLASYGLGVSGQLQLFNLATVSSRTSLATSRLDSPQSSATWKKRVTELRKAYSQRLSAALHNDASEYSSLASEHTWPTPNTAPDAPNGGLNRGNGRTANRNKSQCLGQLAKENWQTPEVQNVTGYQISSGKRIPKLGSQVKEWATPQCHDSQGGKTPEQISAMRDRTGAGVKNLNEMVQEWGTPTSHERTHSPRKVDHGNQLANQALWRTPTEGDNKRGVHPSPAARAGEVNLTNQVHKVHKVWPTPKASEATKCPKDDQRNSPCLSHLVKEQAKAGLARPTPSVRDEKGANGPDHFQNKERPHLSQLPNAVLYSGQNSSPVPASHNTSGNLRESLKLSADWVEALMDIPPMWTDLDYSETEFTPPQPCEPLLPFTES